jgi:hypothetical protein
MAKGAGPFAAVPQSFPVVAVDTIFTYDAGTTAMCHLTTTTNPASATWSRITAARIAGFAVLGFAGLTLTGCQVDVGGQTLPSAYYLQDDIQYFPAGPEFKLSKEAAALKAYKKELAEE